MRPFSLNIRGQLHTYSHPAVMGILNVTPDSFYEKSRALDSVAIEEKVARFIDEGADFIDIGAYSSRPGCADVSEAEEINRLEIGMKALRDIAPDIPVSVDTFRSNVARIAVENLSIDIINDISGGMIDPEMFETVADLRVPYVLMHMRGTPQTMQQHTNYDDLIADMLRELAVKLDQLNLLGVNDVIIDPGLGFSKTLTQNYDLLKHLHAFEIFHRPVLIGSSRKSMVTKLLGVTPHEALQGTTAVNVCALDRGASILRVHDVLAAVQAVKIYQQIQ